MCNNFQNRYTSHQQLNHSRYAPQACLQTEHRLEHCLFFRTPAARTEIHYSLPRVLRILHLELKNSQAQETELLWRNCITGNNFESSKLHPVSSFNAVERADLSASSLAPCLACLPSTMMDSYPSETENQDKLFHKLLLIMVLYHSSMTVTNTEAKKKSYLTLKVTKWHNTIKLLQTLNRNDTQEARKHWTAFPSILPTFPILTHIHS